MKQFIVLISTICLGVLIATFVMGFKTNATDLKTTVASDLTTINTTLGSFNP